MNTTPIQPAATDEAPRVRAPRIDFLLLLAVLGLMACSLVTIARATSNDIPGDPHYYLYRQLSYFAVGLVLAALVMRFDYSRLRELKYGFYALMIGSILLVYSAGTAARGSKRAMSLPFFSFQASELGKLLLVLVLAAFLVDRVRRLHHRETTVRTMLLALIPALMVIAQPDLGSGMVYVVIALSALFVAGTSWRHFAALGALGAIAISITLVAAPAVGVQVLKPYQVDRLTAFLNPSENPASEGYQQTQSRIAIGAGEDRPRPQRDPDAPELPARAPHRLHLRRRRGDLGFPRRGDRIDAVRPADMAGPAHPHARQEPLRRALVAGGIVGMLLFQVFVNVGMTIGIMPITGIPLPLLSYGGSSVIVTLLSIGLLQSIHAQARATAAAKGRSTAYALS